MYFSNFPKEVCISQFETIEASFSLSGSVLVSMTFHVDRIKRSIWMLSQSMRSSFLLSIDFEEKN